ncbi:Phosphoadenosine phosphosulfate reductase [Pseudodesulfovibrio profundus]|uniref:Phosphoadenosine phosphosulfate reductase n=1 Tax=Pseudodesulfovibrio profundus TaxID=57320 RepID=A0A2C8FA90_9BACT|nr:phosphoadenosine phosphosulfate reductase family protein [Pseudodesulfovibrio profundus]SOB59698.1 Phosphoadenosine phosphosulfate reductase [Pseudodesulfovibrio profundus]
MSVQSLDDKIRYTESCLQQVFEQAGPDRAAVAWTGGKDSTVVLYIWLMLLQHHRATPIRAINIDTGCKFPEVMSFRDTMATEWGLDLHVAQPTLSLDSYPLAEDAVTCCHDLKVSPLKKAIRETGITHLISGIRRDEHPDRANRTTVEHRDDPSHTLINPVLEWTEMDIWAFHSRFELPYCILYDEGYRSLGCRPCTVRPGKGEGERGGRQQGKETVMGTLTKLGYF